MPTSEVYTEAPTADWDLEILDAGSRGRGRRHSEETLIARSNRTSSGLGSSPDRGRKRSYGAGTFSFGCLTGSGSIPRGYDVLLLARQKLADFIIFLIPSFVSSWYAGTITKATISPTAWLDGLRGVACVAVVIHHYAYGFSKNLEYPYDGKGQTGWLQLPIIKLIHHGPPMVKIFYIISGFALTVKAVRITRVPRKNTLDSPALLHNLSSSIWKRFLRLFIPCAGGYLLCWLMVSAGLFEIYPADTHPTWITGTIERRPPMKGSLWSQLVYTFWDFYAFAFKVTFLGASDESYNTDVHLWTIPIEFRCSLQLFIIVVGGCMLQRWLRIFCLPILCAYTLYNNAWGLSLFAFGYFLGELHSDRVVAVSSPIPASTKEIPERFLRLKGILRTSLLTFMVTTGLYLASYPRKMEAGQKSTSTGYQFLFPWTPSKYPIGGVNARYDKSHDFWQSIGAILISWALLYMPRAQRLILSNRPVQYFGKISFALYVMHGHVHRSLGYWIVLTGSRFTGIVRWNDKSGQWDLISGHDQTHSMIVVIGFFFITFPVTVWWADVFWRGVDMQSVRFLRWLESKITIEK
ncbi:hypothetical protein EYR41_005989 [Orbilia oligospora]|uniref:Acyltransferase 3 domain-containing protein n=1 Tax=Orbilia oligospora TaxID=2813651 RepID=A0A8H2HS29_ORBOL|nr:hypothetical protein EYR41_005989 [Orbilia oligospora]